MKFSLFSRSSLRSMAAAAVGAPAPAATGGDPEDDDPEAGPQPGDPEDPPADPADHPAPADPPADPADPQDASAPKVVTLEDATAVAGEQHAAGRAAERARTAAVFGDKAALANPSMAAWMLQNSPDASADSIIKQLANMPASAAHAGASDQIADTNVSLGRGAAADMLGAGAEGADVWSSVQGSAQTRRNTTVVPSDAGAKSRAAIAAGAQTVNTTAPAVQPTGY